MILVLGTDIERHIDAAAVYKRDRYSYPEFSQFRRRIDVSHIPIMARKKPVMSLVRPEVVEDGEGDRRPITAYLLC